LEDNAHIELLLLLLLLLLSRCGPLMVPAPSLQHKKIEN
jgi:hypothetical protein